MIEQNLKFIKNQSIIKEEENHEFRSFLKMLDIPDKKLDTIVKKITTEVQKEVDCTKCNNCCKILGPEINNDELENISKLLNISRFDFINNYVIIDDHDNINEFSLISPCPFLKNNKCKIEKIKPQLCITYPYLLKKGFRSRSLGVIDNYGVCPIVYNVYEELKNKLWK